MKVAAPQRIGSSRPGSDTKFVEAAFVDQGYIGDNPEKDSKEAGIALIAVKLAEAKTGIINSKMHGFLSLA